MLTLAIEKMQNKMERLESEVVKLKAKVFELEMQLAISNFKPGNYSAPHI